MQTSPLSFILSFLSSSLLYPLQASSTGQEVRVWDIETGTCVFRGRGLNQTHAEEFAAFRNKELQTLPSEEKWFSSSYPQPKEVRRMIVSLDGRVAAMLEPEEERKPLIFQRVDDGKLAHPNPLIDEALSLADQVRTEASVEEEEEVGR